MAKIRCVAPYEIGLLELDKIVERGEVIDVPDPERYLCQPRTWQAADDMPVGGGE